MSKSNVLDFQIGMVKMLMDISSIRREMILNFVILSLNERGDIMDKQRIYIEGQPTGYFIYPDGRVWSDRSQIFLKPFKNPNGYLLVDLHLNGQSYYKQLHRLVAIYYIPNPNNLPVVNHKDGEKSNCDYRNLEWCTQKENVHHAWKTGLVKPRYGKENPANKYDEETIHLVCKLLEEGRLNYKEISKETGVHETTIYDIRRRGKWKQISSLYDIPNPISEWENIRNRVKQLASENKSTDQIIDELCLENTRKNRNYISGWISFYKKNHALNDYPGHGSTSTS